MASSDSAQEQQQALYEQRTSVPADADHVGPLERSWVNKGKGAAKPPPQRYFVDDKVYAKQTENGFFEGDWIVVQADIIETPGTSKFHWEFRIEDRGGKANPRWVRETFLERQ